MGKKKKKAATYETVAVEGKGNCLRTLVDLKMGDLIFRELSFVYGHWHEDLCFECDEEHISIDECEIVQKLYAKEIVPHLEFLQSKFANDKNMGLDHSRQLIKLINRYQSNPDDVKSFMEKLSYSNLEESKEAWKRIKYCDDEVQKQVINTFVKDLNDDQISLWIAKLNNNTHELQMGGSALFPTALLMEHSCLANSSFQTTGNEIYMTALCDIPSNSLLSIDYINAFCLPVKERKMELKKIYNFDCICEKCTTLPDKARAFVCQMCKEGLVYPYSDSLKLSPCSKCNVVIEDGSIYFKAEEELMLHSVECVEDIDDHIAKKILNVSHHLLFNPLEALATQLSEMDLFEVSAKCWKLVTESAELISPMNHAEKVIFYDHYAQVALCNNDFDLAKSMWKKAFSCSKLSNGSNTPHTNSLKKLMEKTPKNRMEMIEHYNNSM